MSATRKRFAFTLAEVRKTKEYKWCLKVMKEKHYRAHDFFLGNGVLFRVHSNRKIERL